MLSRHLKQLINQKVHTLALIWEVQTRERWLREIKKASEDGVSSDELEKRIAELSS
jgi:hypothetical protein